MGTRSDIIIHRADGKWSRIYCHWDGYLEHNGQILFDHYTSQALAERLVSLGDMSSLAENCDKPEGHTFDKPVKGHCVYYGRDRGERNTQASVGDTLQEVWPPEDTWTEFTYVWDQDKWWVTSADAGTQTLVDLGDALTGKTTIAVPVKAFGCVIGQHKPAKPGKGHGWSSH